jgi:hypothetical protein
MKILEIHIDRMEANLYLRDDTSKTIKKKTFFIYQGSTTPAEVCDFALEVSRKYGVDSIWVNEDGVGMVAYDYLAKKRHTADGFALVRYTSGRLVL